MRIEFTILILPVPKQGDRACLVGDRGIRHYQPKKITANANELAVHMLPYAPDFPFTGPLKLDVTVYYPYTNRMSAKQRSLTFPKDTAPDGDNLWKQVADVMERLGFFATCDGQISDGRLRKLWSRKGPSMRVRLKPDETEGGDVE